MKFGSPIQHTLSYIQSNFHQIPMKRWIYIEFNVSSSGLWRDQKCLKSGGVSRSSNFFNGMKIYSRIKQTLNYIQCKFGYIVTKRWIYMEF